MITHIQTIYVQDKSSFSGIIRAWLIDKGFHVESYNESEELIDRIDSVVIFHENHNFDKSVAELRDLFETRQVNLHKVDMSGTMNVALTHLSLFFERTKCKHVLILGSDELNNHPKMELFKEKWDI